MATSSHPWKQLLLRQAEALQPLRQPHRWSEASTVRLEETVVLGFYAIRRLINAYLLSDALVHRPITMTAYPSQKKTGLLLGDEPLVTLYELKAGREVAHDLLFLCHQITNNCVFVPYFGKDKAIQGVYVTSDHQRKVALYGVTIESVQNLFREVGGAH